MTIGIDLGDTYSGLSFLDEAGDVIEESCLRSTERALAARFADMAPCRVILEVGTRSPCVSRLLSTLGHEMIIANPYRVRLIAKSGVKNDRSDAETLARQGPIDPSLLSPVRGRWIPTPDFL